MDNNNLIIFVPHRDLYFNKGEGGIDLEDEQVKALIYTIKIVSKNTTAVCTAGFNSEDPLVPEKKKDARKTSLAKQMEKCLDNNLNKNKITKRYFEPKSWGIKNQIRLGIKIAKHKNLVDSESENMQLFICSNRWQLMRIRLHTRFYAPKNWKLNFVSLKRNLSFSNILNIFYEFRNLGKDIIYFLRIYKRHIRRKNFLKIKVKFPQYF